MKLRIRWRVEMDAIRTHGAKPTRSAGTLPSMAPKKQGPIRSVADPRYVKATGHPLRLRILAMLAERKLTPTQLAAELGSSLGTTAYHVKVLDELGLIDLVDETRVRGTVAHHYRASALPEQDSGTWGEAAAVVKQAALGSELAHVGQRATTAAAAGGFDGPDAVIRRTELRLDAAGRKKLARALARLDADLQKLESVNDGEPFTVVAMAFSAPVEPPESRRLARTPTRARLGS